MNLSEILQSLQVLCNHFTYYHQEWVHLKTQQEFVFDVEHQSPVRRIYEEGGGCAFYLKSALNTSYVNTTILVNEYVEKVQASIPPEAYYLETGEAAQKDFSLNYPHNYTVQAMLRLYWEQWETVKRVEHLISALIATSAYQLLDRSTPMQLIQHHVKHWEQNAQLHKGLGENALRSQLVLALQSAGFPAGAETHAFQGHADIVVPRPLYLSHINNGHQFIGECKIWNGSAALSSALSQLCQYVTPNDSHAALIVFVNSGSFNDTCRKAVQCLAAHPSHNGHTVKTADCIEYSLIPAQNKLSQIPATLLLCNLTTTRYP